MQWNMAMDVGSSFVRMAVDGRGIQFRQSAAIALRQGESEPLAVGDDAHRLLMRAPAMVSTGFPMRGNTIADEALLSMWYNHLFRLAASRNLVKRPRLLLSCHSSMQPTPMRHMVALAMESGAAACAVIRSDVCAALGAPLDIRRPQATLCCELGAHHLSVALLSGARVVASDCAPTGMGLVDDVIVRRMRNLHGMAIGPVTAEELKLSLASAEGLSAPGTTVHAMDAATGFPREFSVPAGDVKDCARGVTDLLVELIHSVLRRAPAELAADLPDSGIVLTGGGAQLFGLDRVIAEAFGLACHVPQDPGDCVINGLLKVMESPDDYEHLTMAHGSILKR